MGQPVDSTKLAWPQPAGAKLCHIDKAFDCAVAVLQRNRALLDRSATDLLTKETFSSNDLEQISASVIPVMKNQEVVTETKTVAASPL